MQITSISYTNYETLRSAKIDFHTTSYIVETWTVGDTQSRVISFICKTAKESINKVKNWCDKGER